MNNLPATSANPNENYEKLRSAIAEAQTQGDTKTVVSLQKQLGQAYMEAGDAPLALTEFNEAIKLVFKSEDDKEIFAQLLGFRGLALKLIGNYSLAMQAFRKSNALALEIKHSALSCDSLIHLAALHSETGKIDEAIAVLNEALGIASEYKDKVRIMRINGLLGDNFFKRVEPAKASEYFQLAYDAAQNLGNRAAGCSFITKLGNVFLLEGKSERAIDKYEYALKLASALADRNAEINILGGLFRAHALAGNIDPAFTYGEQVIHLAAEISHYEAEIANIQALALFSIEHGQAGKALSYLGRGFEVAKEQVNMGWEMELLTLSSKAYSAQEKFAEALNSLDEALTLAIKLQDESFMANT
jgi:tetratricopeptide (TPR) repeat protein